jgi:hypothetical protein
VARGTERRHSLIVLTYHGNKSQLTTFSVPSNNAAILPPPALYENFLTWSGGFVVTFLMMSIAWSVLKI